MTDTAIEDLIRVAHAWDRAMVTNDPVAIGRFMADDWVIVGPDGKVTEKEAFLDTLRSGDLTHDVMTSEEITVRLHGDAAVLTSRGVSGGTWRGHPFREVERSSNVFIRQGGEWRCVLTHLSKLPVPPPG